MILYFRYALRSIKRSKGIALGVALSMALGIGATASVFSFVDSAVLRPLPVPETHRVVRITNSTPAGPIGSFSYPEYRDYVERSRSFSGIVTYQNATIGFSVKPGDEPRVILATLVSGNFFSTLQVKPIVGRGFVSEEDSAAGRNTVAILSYAEWQRDFGGAVDVVGRVVTINGHAFTIIGVAPREFTGVQPFIQPAIYLPRAIMEEPYMGLDSSWLTNRANRFMNLLARLKPGVTVEQAKADVGRIASQLEAEHPETNKTWKAVVLTQSAFRQAGGPGLRIAVLFLSIAFLVLGIACVNVSNLLLSTVPTRTREMAVRIAMGAPRARLLEQLLIESAILSIAGTLGGLAIASRCADFLSSIPFAGLDSALSLQTKVDGRVVIFTLVVGFVSALTSGSIPAWRCSRSDLNFLLKTSDPRNQPPKMRGRQLLAASQVAVTTIVLVFSAFLLKDFRMAATQNPGFRVDHLLTLNLDASIAAYNREQSRRFYTELVARVRAMPGVKSAAIAQDKPFGLVNNGLTNLTIEGYESPENQQSIGIRSSFVGDGYFQTLDIPIIRGRAFDRRDDGNAPRAVIVNELMAEKFWPGRDPIGASVDIKGDGGGPAEVIGIARNSKYNGMQERPMPFLYRSYEQGKETGAALFVETDGSPEAFISAIRAEIRNIAPHVAVFDVRTMQDHFRSVGLLEQRLIAQIFTAVAAVALVLGILGLYAVVAYSVGQRTYEIGIRMALGASDRQVLRMVLLKGLKSSGIAAAIGIGLALQLSGMSADVVTYVNLNDPAIYIGVFLVMLAVTGAACYVPARRASMVDPNTTLRS